MKINKSFLLRIIKEEIKKSLYDDESTVSQRKFIRVLTVLADKLGNSNIPTPDIERLLKTISNVSGVQDVKGMLTKLKDDKSVNPALLSRFDQLLFHGDIGTNSLPPSYQQTLQSPSGGITDRRSAMEDPINQEDTRKKDGIDKKNLVHEEN